MAMYDAKPSKLEAVGNGSYLYRFNIEEKTYVVEEAPEVETENEQEAPEPKTRTQWECDEVTIYEPLTANKITEAVISSV